MRFTKKLYKYTYCELFICDNTGKVSAEIDIEIDDKYFQIEDDIVYDQEGIISDNDKQEYSIIIELTKKAMKHLKELYEKHPQTIEDLYDIIKYGDK